MARLPTYEPQVSPQIGGPVRVDTGGEAVGQGLRQLGAGIGQVGAALEYRQKEAEQKEDFNAIQRHKLLREQSQTALNAARDAAPADGSGLSDDAMKRVKALQADFMKSLPNDKLRERYGLILASDTEEVHRTATGVQTGMQGRWSLNELGRSEQQYGTEVQRDPNSYDTNLALFDREIDVAPGLNPQTRAMIKQKARDNLRMIQANEVWKIQGSRVTGSGYPSTSMTSGAAPGASGYGATNAPYKRALDAPGEGGHTSPRAMFGYLKSIGASDNEALMLTGAAANESSFNQGAVHDNGTGYGLFGHNTGRLDMRGKGWQDQAGAALAELRSRPEARQVANATSPEALADAQMRFERPRGYTSDNPRGGDNYTGRLNTIRYFSQMAGGGDAPIRDQTGSVGTQPAAPSPALPSVQVTRRPDGYWGAPNVRYFLAGKTRDKPVSQQYVQTISSVVAGIDPSLTILVTSGGQDDKKRTGSHRHDVDASGEAHTSDLVLMRDGKQIRPGDDKALYARVMEGMAAAGMTGIGHYGWGIHVGNGTRAAWGPSTGSGDLDPEFGAAIQRGWARAGTPGATGSYQSPQMAEQDRARQFFMSDPRFANLGIDNINKLVSNAVTYDNQQQTLARANLEPRLADAQAAIMSTGRYDGQLPSQREFTAAYGEGEGAQRYAQFQRVQAVGEKVAQFQTAPNAEITAAVTASKPVGAGPGFAQSQAEHETLAKAGAAVIKAREDDPAGFVTRTNPALAAMANDPATMPQYLAGMAAEQKRLGIPPEKMALLPDAMATKAIEVFKNETAPIKQRIGAVVQTVLTSPDKDTRQAVFRQMVKAGLPAEAEGAIEAYASQGEGAGERLMSAVMSDPAKVSGKISTSPAKIREAIQGRLMQDGQIGDIAYFVSSGDPNNLARAERGQALMLKAVQARMAGGADLEPAIDAVAKDMFGTPQIVQSLGGMRAALALAPDADKAAIARGAGPAREALGQAIRERAMEEVKRIGIPEGALADATIGNAVTWILSGGEWRNFEGGMVFTDPRTGQPVGGKDGKPLVFSLDHMIELGKTAQEDQAQRLDQMRREFQDAQPVNPAPTGFGNMSFDPSIMGQQNRMILEEEKAKARGFTPTPEPTPTRDIQNQARELRKNAGKTLQPSADPNFEFQP